MWEIMLHIYNALENLCQRNDLENWWAVRHFHIGETYVS